MFTCCEQAYSTYWNVMSCKSPKISQCPRKPRQGDQLIHRRYTKSRSQKPNLFFRFGAWSKSRTVEPRRQHGAMVAVGDDGGRVVAQEWNRCNRPEYTPGQSIPGYIMA